MIPLLIVVIVIALGVAIYYIRKTLDRKLTVLEALDLLEEQPDIAAYLYFLGCIMPAHIQRGIGLRVRYCPLALFLQKVTGDSNCLVGDCVISRGVRYPLSERLIQFVVGVDRGLYPELVAMPAEKEIHLEPLF